MNIVYEYFRIEYNTSSAIAAGSRSQVETTSVAPVTRGSHYNSPVSVCLISALNYLRPELFFVALLCYRSFVRSLACRCVVISTFCFPPVYNFFPQAEITIGINTFIKAWP